MEIDHFLISCLRGKYNHHFCICPEDNWPLAQTQWSSPSGTVPTLGTLTWLRGDFSRLGAEVAFHLPWPPLSPGGTMVGLCLTWVEAVLGPQVFPFTASPGTVNMKKIRSICFNSVFNVSVTVEASQKILITTRMKYSKKEIKINRKLTAVHCYNWDNHNCSKRFKQLNCWLDKLFYQNSWQHYYIASSSSISRHGLLVLLKVDAANIEHELFISSSFELN